MYDNTLRKMFDQSFVGFDEVFDRLSRFSGDMKKAIPTYPPYNIKKVDDNRYCIELAVAGFGKTDIDVVIEDGTLTIKGETKSQPENQMYLFKGIADRAFKRTFNVADTIEIRNAELINGMLRVWLENIIPDHKKPRKVDVTEPGEVTGKQLLNE